MWSGVGFCCSDGGAERTATRGGGGKVGVTEDGGRTGSALESTVIME